VFGLPTTTAASEETGKFSGNVCHLSVRSKVCKCKGIFITLKELFRKLDCNKQSQMYRQLSPLSYWNSRGNVMPVRGNVMCSLGFRYLIYNKPAKFKFYTGNDFLPANFSRTYKYSSCSCDRMLRGGLMRSQGEKNTAQTRKLKHLTEQGKVVAAFNWVENNVVFQEGWVRSICFRYCHVRQADLRLGWWPNGSSKSCWIQADRCAFEWKSEVLGDAQGWKHFFWLLCQ